MDKALEKEDEMPVDKLKEDCYQSQKYVFGNVSCGAVLSQGITKRELFAAMAMQGMLASETSSYNYGAQENLAVNAVRRADALLAELNKGKEDIHE